LFHRTVQHRNILLQYIPQDAATTQTYFILGITHYMFRTVFPSIIKSSRLYIQQQVYVKQILLAAASGN
jgi:hypothetical protein